ncbi:XRE family transcriptional regulator [Lactobacillus acetotolerans]|uniref:helix-turn-helix domain-containing protein n=1 Tax=Lactobacillus acetotolerans TaxID=1600 RepID=UPI002FDAA16A
MDFGNGLRELREKRRLGVNQLALKSGVSASQISRFENGKFSKPKPDTLRKLAIALDVKEAVLFGLAGYLMPPENIKATPTSDGATLTADNPNMTPESVEKYINQLQSERPVVEANIALPVYGQIHAGSPAFADQNIIGSTPITNDLVQQYGRDNLFALQIKGDSMSRVIPDGYVAIFSKDVEPENNDIVATLIDGEDATIKRFKETSLAVMFEPDSYNPIYKPIIFQKKGKQNFKILGKYIYATSMPM